MKIGSAVSMAFILLAYFFKQDDDVDMRGHLDDVLSGLLRAELKVPRPSQTRVAVGFGSCRDVNADGIEVFQTLADGVDIGEPNHVDEITNVQEVTDIFTYFFQHGAAAERYISNTSLFDEMVNIAETLPETRSSLGGNAPVMANRFQKEGCKVLLGTQMSENLHTLIDKEIQVTGSLGRKDDIHLVLEYDKGNEWKAYTSPRANRFIVHNDQTNPHIASLEDFEKEIKEFSPDLIVIGGLQMMDSFPFKENERQSRLKSLRQLLATTPRENKIHFEMASFAEESCLRDVIDNVVYHADSLGMNEQELPNLYSLLTNGSVTLLSDTHPRIATTLDHMRAVYAILDKTSESNGQRRLTRLHVHTLAYQAIMTTKGSSWKHTMSATAKASLVANRHTCGSNNIHPDKAKILMDDSFLTSRGGEGLRMPFQPERPVSCWAEDRFEICIAPVLVCTEVVQTAGGGDNISSAGLVLQI